VKNLTLEDNIRRIIINSDNEYNDNRVRYGINNEQISWTEQVLRILQSTVNHIRNHVTGQTHLYGLTTPQSLISSDFDDVKKTIFVEDVPFNTLEGIKNELVDKLISGHEVYVYSINKVEIMTAASLLPEVRYYMRYKCVHRSEWSELITQYEHNRELAVERGQWLNRWMGLGQPVDTVNERVVDDEIPPQKEIYTEQKSENDSLINGKIKKFKF
jgi:hypothetical protein